MAVDITDNLKTQGDVWVFDLDRDTRTRLAAGPIDESRPVWNPDDSEVYFLDAKTGLVRAIQAQDT